MKRSIQADKRVCWACDNWGTIEKEQHCNFVKKEVFFKKMNQLGIYKFSMLLLFLVTYHPANNEGQLGLMWFCWVRLYDATTLRTTTLSTMDFITTLRMTRLQNGLHDNTQHNWKPAWKKFGIKHDYAIRLRAKCHIFIAMLNKIFIVMLGIIVLNVVKLRVMTRYVLPWLLCRVSFCQQLVYQNWLWKVAMCWMELCQMLKCQFNICVQIDIVPNAFVQRVILLSGIPLND